MISTIKSKIKTSKFFWKWRSFITNKITGNNKIAKKGINNQIDYGTALLLNSRILIKGNNNAITFGNQSRLEVDIKIYGDNNVIEIGENCSVKGTKFWVEDQNNKILIGNATTIEKDTELACIEGCNITIGVDCMLSSDIVVRTGDSHSIVDLQGKRINPSRNVVVGNHVWIGHKAVLSKGAGVSNHSIVASGAMVTSSFEEGNCILGGFPAVVIKSNIDWMRERI
ncbi:hypothetical protein [Pedobacter sp. MC2016-24]|uniref:acyltransferase n=1 Tax=Pedobacter sp. MC2016-24 TaxID=2780090 RepID=UPI00187E8BF6|nr:hypothetical protein [Pedobacter sp. MC2016-24]MBE9600307.1 hypothetical protein [Pedobacter sp. MC2016-24]